MGMTLKLREAEGQGWLAEEVPAPTDAERLQDFAHQVEADIADAEGIIVDLFAGGGGASHGIWMATGRHPDVAINHDAQAVAMHAINHPTTLHWVSKITSIDPLVATGGRRVRLLWASPDCKHFSKAKGGKPVQKNIRDLAWVVVHWAKRVRPTLICVENVEEFITWGPLLDGRPDPERKGEEFHRWVRALRGLGYTVEWRELKACDYGVPTTRKRLFIVARLDGPVSWPEPTHAKGGAGGLLPWRAAAECIDWSIPTESIFDRKPPKKPLVPATCARLAQGIFRFVLNHAAPFLVPLTHQGDSRVYDMADPMRTVTGANRGEIALVTPLTAPVVLGYHRREDAIYSPEDPLRTQDTSNRYAIVVPTLNGCGGRAGQSRPRGADEPAATITAKADTCLTVTHLAPFGIPRYGEREGQDPRTLSIEEPSPAIVPTQNGFTLCTSEIAAFMAQHNTGSVGHPLAKPLSTICQSGTHQQLVTASHILIQRNNSVGREMGQPAPTSTAHTNHLHVVEVTAAHLEVMRNHATGQDLRTPAPTIAAEGNHQWLATTETVPAGEPLEDMLAEGVKVDKVLAFLLTYYGTAQKGSLQDPLHTVTCRDRFGVVTLYAVTVIEGVLRALVDIHMRMLAPRELYRAQGFPDSYVIDPIVNGKRLTKTAQVRMVGNSVCPGLAAAVVSANYSPTLIGVAA